MTKAGLATAALPKVIHPPLIAAAPVVLIYAQNAGVLPLGTLVRPVAVAVAVAAAVWFLVGVPLHSAAKGAAAASLLLVGIAAYSTLAPRMGVDPGPGRQATYLVALLLIAAFAAWRTKREGGLGTQAANVFSVALILLSVGRAVTALRQVSGSEAGRAMVGGRDAERPDIYYIVLDGFGREDALRAKTGWDDRFFTDGLRRLGFFVADRSRANYVQTELSLASSLNMEHLTTLLPGRSARDPNRAAFDRLIENNAVARTLEARGYRFITVTTGFPAIEFPPRVSGYTAKGGLSLLETTVIALTPLGEERTVAESQFIARREWLSGAFDALSSLAGESNTPRFVFAHILAPHPPFVYDAKGDPVAPSQGFGYYDGSDYMERGGTPEEYRRGYAGQAEWVARRTLAAVGRLVSASKRPPIVIVQGDHGPKSGLQQNSLEGTDLAECGPNLNAYFVPPEVRAKLDPGITPVNSFRVVLGTLFGLDLPRRPDRSYYSPFAKPMELTDVTARIPDVVR